MNDINQGRALGDEVEDAALDELEIEDSVEALSTVEVILKKLTTLSMAILFLHFSSFA